MASDQESACFSTASPLFSLDAGGMREGEEERQSEAESDLLEFAQIPVHFNSLAT